MKSKSKRLTKRVYALVLLGALVIGGILFAVYYQIYLAKSPLAEPKSAASSPSATPQAKAGQFLLAAANTPAPYSTEEWAALYGTGTQPVLTFAEVSAPIALALSEGEKPANGLYSPVSFYAALSVLADALDGPVQETYLGVLGQTAESLRPNNDLLFRTLATFPSIDPEASGELTIANSIWANQKVTLNQPYLEDLAKHFYTSTYQGALSSEEAGEAVSDWISQNTGGKQNQNLFSPGEDDGALIHFVNALYFRGQWMEPFPASETEPLPFYLAEGGEVSAPFMFQLQSDSYFYDGDGFAVAGLLFTGGASLDFMLPDEGIAPRALLEDESARSVLFSAAPMWELDGMQLGDVSYYVPKFDLALKSSLIPAMDALGLSGSVPFPRLTEAAPEIARADQYNTFSIDEKGVVASAVTDIVTAESAASPQEEPLRFELRLNRPFLFILRVSGYPLFIGVIDNPTL